MGADQNKESFPYPGAMLMSLFLPEIRVHILRKFGKIIPYNYNIPCFTLNKYKIRTRVLIILNF